jgi:hypothetical protein
MKQRVLVWLPPDGDSRLFQLQQQLAQTLHRSEFLARPAHWVLNEARPRTELRTGGWRMSDEGLFLEVHEQNSLVGWLRLAEPWFPDSCEPPLPAQPEFSAPDWVWRRGKLAWMEFGHEAEAGVHWLLEPVSGWKAEEARGSAD